MFNPIWEKFPFNLLVFFDLKHHDIMSGFDSHSCIRNDRDFYKSWNNPLETNYEKRHPHYEPEPTMISGHDFMPSLQRTRNVHSQPWCRRRERPRAREHLQLERQERNPYWCYIWPETRWLGHKPTCSSCQINSRIQALKPPGIWNTSGLRNAHDMLKSGFVKLHLLCCWLYYIHLNKTLMKSVFCRP